MNTKIQDSGTVPPYKLKATASIVAPNPVSVMVPDGAGTYDPDAYDPIAHAKELQNIYHGIGAINFELTAMVALDCIDQFLEHFLPDGEFRGRQYVAYNPHRHDGELGSFQINIDEGFWKDFATEDKGGDLISLIAFVLTVSQTEAAVKILELIAGQRTDDAAPVIKKKSSKTKQAAEFTAIMPIPESALAKRPTSFFDWMGTLSATWVYCNEQGQAMCYVHRFDRGNGTKTFLPQTYCQDADGFLSWKSQAPPVPRPAYGLDRLAARPDATVLFVEGEKSADAAQRLFPDFVAVTTMNGSQSPEKTDFSPFAGRKVYIAPDNDEAGQGYATRLTELLANVGATVMGVMRLGMLVKGETELPKGYDLADAEQAGWTVTELAALGDSLWEPVQAAQVLSQSDDTDQYVKPTKQKMPETDMDYVLLFAEELYQHQLAYCNNQLLAYTSGYWQALDVTAEVKSPIATLIGHKATASRATAILELLKIRYAEKPDLFERSSALICLNNGTLNPLTGELLEHNPEHFLTNKVDITFDPSATCPLWLQTLDEIFAPDSDKAEKIQLLQEFIGYCLIPDTRMHKFLWMVGAGGNGKSLILEVLNALVGKENISFAQIERLQEKFVRSELQGKLVNISSEMSAQATISDGYLKQIVAGDIVEAERKYQPSFSFKPYSRLIGATNMLPRLLDHSDGFFRRAMILRLNRQFTEAEQDKQRVAKLMLELPGILNWSVAGLQTLLARGYFEIPASSKAEAESYRINSDPVRQFANDYLVVTDDKRLWVNSGELYRAYQLWSHENGYKQLASNQFAERLTSIGFVKGRCNNRRYWEAEYIGRSENFPSPVMSVTVTSSLAEKYKV